MEPSLSIPSLCPLLLLIPWILAASAIAAPSSSPEGAAAGKPALPGYSVRWLDDRNAFLAGDMATIMIRPFGVSPDETDFGRYAVNFTLSVDGKKGNSSRVSTVMPYTPEGDCLSWNITFVPIWAGSFMAIVEEEHSGAMDSSLHFRVAPGKLYPSACMVSWMSPTTEFIAGTKANILILPKDAFGNNISSTTVEVDPSMFMLTASYEDGSVANLLNSTYMGWNELGYLEIEFVPITSGSLLLHLTSGNQTLNGSPLSFTVQPGVLDIKMCPGKWKHETNLIQIFSRLEFFVYQRDQFGNPVPGFDQFDAGVAQKETNMSIPVGDLFFQEVGEGIQLLSFIVTEAGNFTLRVFDAEQNWSISNTSYDYSVFVDLRGSRDANSLFRGVRIGFRLVSPVSGRHRVVSVSVSPETIKSRTGTVFRSGFVSPKAETDTFRRVGYCDGVNSVVNGSGLTGSVVGRMSYFSVYLEDVFHNPAPVEDNVLTVQILRKNDTVSVRPIIFPRKNFDGIVKHHLFLLVFNIRFCTLQSLCNYKTGEIWVPEDNALTKGPEVTPSGFHDHQDGPLAAKSTIQTSAFHVVYIPEKCGNYDIWVFCGNIPLNGGQPYTMNASPGTVDASLSRVGFVPRIKRLVRNEVAVQLVDSFSNPITSEEAKLSFKIDPVNTSNFLRWMFADKGGGLYIGHYLARDLGNYNICVLYEDAPLSPCPFEVNVHNREYFPEANNDNIFVWEDESVSFDAIGNDYFAGKHGEIIDSSLPVHGSLIHYGQLFRYSPYKGFFGNDSFAYTISDVNENIDTGTIFISVLCKPPQFVSLPVHLQVMEDVISPKFGGFSGFAIKHSDKLEKISVTLRAQYGSIFLAPMPLQLSIVSGHEITVTRGGRTGEELMLSGIVEVVNSVLESIQYHGKENFYGNDVISLYAMNRNGMQDAHVPVNVEPVNDAPFIHVPRFIMLKETENGFQIFDEHMDSFQSLIGDPDLDNFPGNKSNFVVTLSLELNDGILISSLPDHLIRTVELKIKNSHQWQHLQTFVTISNYFVIKAKGIRIRASIDDCNSAMQKLLYQGSGLGAVLTISVNDMGNYGCYVDCTERISLPLYTEVAVNLIKKRPINSISAR
ncbi:hypothetical protein Taro_033821, partial [Colocasia esculenta]|nr:hypothetical protein [Colocasia esculenta]